MPGVHRLRKGLDLPIGGRPQPTLQDAAPSARVALLAADYPGLKPTMEVQVGDRVLRGQRLFHEKKNPAVRFTSPAAGTVTAIHRGEKRALISVVIELDAGERDGRGECLAFDSYTGRPPAELEGDEVRALLLESGLWTALRTRPFSRVPDPGSTPRALFVTAMDTHPLAPAPEDVLAGRERDFEAGLGGLARLTPGPTYLCTAAGSALDAPPDSAIRVERFEGPHPAGTAGVHIHVLDPVHRAKTVWHVGYQDVAAIGTLLATGALDVARVISLAGPGARHPRLLRTRIGACTADLTRNELADGAQRIVSGSVLGGRTAQGDAEGYLGRYHHQITLLPEANRREFLGWLAPGKDKFSVTNAFASALSRARLFPFTTSTNGSRRPMVPIGTYEQVMPMDLEPTFLLRALITGDLEQAEQLGALELDEEDLALATFVCPGKYEYGPLLRELLDRIQREE